MNPEVGTVKINFAFVQTITIDALLYMLAIINRASGKSNCGIYVSKNNKPDVDTLIEQSGFFDYASSMNEEKKKQEQEAPAKRQLNQDNDTGSANNSAESAALNDPLPRSSDFVRIRVGHESDPDIIRAFSEFVMEKHKVSLQDTQELYVALIEITSNSDEHAFHSKRDIEKPPHWFAFSRYDTQSDTTIFSVLDMGSGITSTIRRKPLEFLLVKAGLNAIMNRSDDLKLMRSALAGDFRTSTNKEERGLGIPRLYDFSMSNNISNMILVSGRAYIDVSNPAKDFLLNTVFEGTLYTWRYHHDNKYLP